MRCQNTIHYKYSKQIHIENNSSGTGIGYLNYAAINQDLSVKAPKRLGE